MTFYGDKAFLDKSCTNFAYGNEVHWMFFPLEGPRLIQAHFVPDPRDLGKSTILTATPRLPRAKPISIKHAKQVCRR